MFDFLFIIYTFPQNVYFHTPIIYPDILLVVEIAAIVNNVEQSCGWGKFELFSFDDVPDSSESKNAPTSR